MSSRAIYPAAAAVLAGLAFGAPSPASAQYCEGTVHGLSRHYNLATGSGFLAVRARPSSSSRMIGQLFNGDHTEIFDRRGNWYKVGIGGATGWANARWLRNDCGY
ncbi:SH3 domain-containing protein [Mesorhizobium sp. AR10]|uniref:SH3 domain-containing protein n=1 Tax=Mesorhizobium sp. AR10 TaxID=2865839 RepID=UPI00215EEAF9|nr:SH3 domain-containing protein [Mesorhizobium sp. AR10]UVK36752.1 SH3 domain-containing protein [Mesorhizobium sp. AR10]